MLPFGATYGTSVQTIPGGLLANPYQTMNKAQQLQLLNTLPQQQQLLMRQTLLPQLQLGGLGLPGGTLAGLNPLNALAYQKGLASPASAILSKITRPYNENEPVEKLKKAHYRDELLTQIELNKLSRADQYRQKALEDQIEELRLQKERQMTDSRLDQDINVKRRNQALGQGQDQPVRGRNAQSMVDLRLPNSRYKELDRSRDSSMDRSTTRQSLRLQFRDEFSKNPKRRVNVVDMDWIDNPVNQPQKGNEWWQKGVMDPVQSQMYWDNGKYIPSDINEKVKEIIQREVKIMKGKMQQDEVAMLEQMKLLKDQTKDTDKARIRALDHLKKIKSKLHKQQVKEDMRHNYIYDVLFQRWQDRERKLEDKYKKFPAVNSFPIELRKTEVNLKRKLKKEGELPSDSKVIQNNSIKIMDDMWPQLPTLDDFCKEKMNQDIFKAESLNKVNARRLQDLDKFQLSQDALDKIDNQMFDFLNRESNKQVINAAVDGNGDGQNYLISNDVLKNYQEVHLKDYISPLEQFSKQVVHNNISNPHKSVDPLIHKLNALRLANIPMLYGVGTGYNGQLFHDQKDDDWTCFKKIQDFKEIFEIDIESCIDIYCGPKHSMLYNSKNDKLYIWGEHIVEGSKGKEICMSIPRQIQIDNKVQKVSCGFEHTLIMNEFQIFSFGKNNYGQLGQSAWVKYQEIPVLVKFDEGQKFKEISAGVRSSYVISQDNDVFAFGSNKFYELGLVQEEQQPKYYMPMKLSVKAKYIGSGFKHTILLSEDQSQIYCCGSNKVGQIGLKELMDKNQLQNIQLPCKFVDSDCQIKKIYASWNNTIIMMKNRSDQISYYIVGDNKYGQLAQGQQEQDQLKFSSEWQEIIIQEQLIREVYCQSESFVALTNDNKIYSWGWNEHGNLGLDDKLDRHSPQEILSLDITENSKLFCGGAYMLLLN
ncbi:rcc1 and btb domain-containing protein [Stylonychia lemnae]|uniref:Rcc1 and btb domain-containing protein n=1 Tax=Stylonychia lemnae TaxID=5949 RepID=A0A078AZS8_STYLE|nr:rcc1 and btb domain-containing protein [Stylonychia lemnae]|eukprot:CDW87729.1 rcc1 and btb domain-containing protein [Stylonychia lemnae]